MADLFTLAASAFPAGSRALSFSTREALSELYRVDLHVLVPAEAGAPPRAASLLFSRVSLATLREDGSTRQSLHGVVVAARVAHQVAGHTVFSVTLAPAAWRLTLSEHSRVHVGRTVRQILEDTLRAGGLAASDFELRLRGRHDVPLEHVSQYRESDWAFAARWMERSGIYFYFEHGDAQEKLIAVDDKGAHAPLAADPVRFFDTSHGDVSAVEGVHSFSLRREYRAASVKVTDYEYARPDTPVTAQAPGAQPGAGERVFFGEDNQRGSDPVAQVARARAGAERARAATYYGAGRVFDLRPGYTFDLADHPRAAFGASYLVTQLAQGGTNTADDPAIRRLLGLAVTPQYRASFAAIKADEQYRPELATPVPQVRGEVGARVDGPVDSEYAQLDDQGRYLVAIQYDEASHNRGQASSRVRMAQPYGGNPEGWHFPLRSGTEVRLSFVGGDPDRPVIVGAVPNPETPSPVTSANATMNVIQTGGRNRFEFEDDAEKRYIDLYSPPERSALHLGKPHAADEYRMFEHKHYYASRTDGNGLVHTGGDLDITVGGKKTERVERTVTETYKNTQTTAVTEHVEETYHAKQDTHVAVLAKETYGDHTTVTPGTTTETTPFQRTQVTTSLTETISTQSTTNSMLHREKCASQTFTVANTSNQTCGLLLLTVDGATKITSTPGFNLTSASYLLTAPIYNLIAGPYNFFASISWLKIAPLTVSIIYGLKTTAEGGKVTFAQNKFEMVLGLSFTLGGFKMEIVSQKAKKKGQKTKGREFELRAGTAKVLMKAAAIW
ncbi:MAG: type VI secretion system tip protein TssI/VgrG [Polyangiales bacterium]